MGPTRTRGIIAGQMLHQLLTVDALLARAAATERKYGEVRKWLVLRASQMFAVAFNAGLLAVYLALVVFTELAFGWSTTLDVDVARVQVLVETLASGS